MSFLMGSKFTNLGHLKHMHICPTGGLKQSLRIRETMCMLQSTRTRNQHLRIWTSRVFQFLVRSLDRKPMNFPNHFNTDRFRSLSVRDDEHDISYIESITLSKGDDFDASYYAKNPHSDHDSWHWYVLRVSDDYVRIPFSNCDRFPSGNLMVMINTESSSILFLNFFPPLTDVCTCSRGPMIS
jgi:hypothetical protein